MIKQEFDQFYYRSQAQKRLRLAYEYARSDLESGNYVEVYHLCAGVAGVEIRYMFSGPERNMWHDIRAYGRYMHFYPEYPIGEDYVDFVDPYKKIAIEVDGNLHNPTRDAVKDKRLAAAGYRVIRVASKYAEKDLEEIWETIEATKLRGKSDVAKFFEDELPKNGQAIIKALRREFTPKQQVNKEDLRKTVDLADYANSPEFKEHHSKYYTNRPKELDDAIAAIPLIKLR